MYVLYNENGKFRELRENADRLDRFLPGADPDNEALGDLAVRYIEIDKLPDWFNINDGASYSIKDGKLVNEPYKDPSQEDIDIQNQMLRASHMSVATGFLMQTATVGAEITDAQALSVPMVFDKWSPDGVEYSKGMIRRYNDILYRYINDEKTVSQKTWNPADAHSLWVRIKSDTIEEWYQKTAGIDELYQVGDQVTHNGFTWKSDYPNNVWEPGVFGWTKVDS